MRLNQVGTSRQLFDKHIQHEASFFYKSTALVTNCFFWRYWWNVHTGKTFWKRLAKCIKIAVPPEYFKSLSFKHSVDSVTNKISVFQNLRVLHTEMSSSILSSKTSFDFELPLQLTVVFLFTIQISHAHKLLLGGNLHYIWLHASFSEKLWSLLSRQEPHSFVWIYPRDVALKLLQAATHTAIYNTLRLCCL